MYKAAVCVVTGCFALPLHAQQPLDQTANVPETLQLTLVTDQIAKPAYAVSPPGDVARVFIIEPWDDNSKGWIRLIKDGSFVPQPFLEISPVSQGFTTGLLCVAFDSNYATNGFFYVTYTDQATNNIKVSRFQVSADPDVANPASETPVMTIIHPLSVHNGGWLAFGPDGYLYISTGDGGPANDSNHYGQDDSVLLGKVLRVDVHADDFPADPGRNYAIPPDNPFVGGPGLDEIWALGLRVPWRCSFDRAAGDLYISNVGENSWEEVNFQEANSPGGVNYGWRCREGAHDLFDDPECLGQTFTDPIYEYPNDGSNCAVIGGYVYRGTAIPELAGKYLLGDYCSSRIWSFRYDGQNLTDFVEHCIEVDGDPLFNLGQITSFGEDACGELYVCAYQNQVFKIVGSNPIEDCNSNGIEDGCEINLGLAMDINANGIPDACDPPCPWDCEPTPNGAVDVPDLLVLLATWGLPGPCDIDGSGTVAVPDLLELLAKWGPCP